MQPFAQLKLISSLLPSSSCGLISNPMHHEYPDIVIWTILWLLFLYGTCINNFAVLYHAEYTNLNGYYGVIMHARQWLIEFGTFHYTWNKVYVECGSMHWNWSITTNEVVSRARPSQPHAAQITFSKKQYTLVWQVWLAGLLMSLLTVTRQMN